MSKNELEKRTTDLEGRSGTGKGTYVLKISMWRPGLPVGDTGAIHWLMKPTADGEGEYVKTLTPEEAEALE